MEIICLIETTRGELRAYIGVEVAPGSRWRDVAFADHEVAEALAGLALLGVALDQGGERRDDLVVPDVLAVQLVQARAVEGGAEIEVVLAGGAPDQADLGEIGPGAAVGAAGHADHDVVVAQARRAAITSSSAVTRSGR